MGNTVKVRAVNPLSDPLCVVYFPSVFRSASYMAPTFTAALEHLEQLCSGADEDSALPFYKALENSAAKVRNDKLE